MADDTAKVAEEPATPAEEQPTDLTQAEQDALSSISDVDGTLVDNPDISTVSVEEPTSDEEPTTTPADEPTEPGGAESPAEEVKETTPTDAPKDDITTETDEAGVYSPPAAEDPGDFKPGDYSFEVRTTDGKTHKISSPEEAVALASRLDEEPDLISASQFMQLNSKTALMEQSIATDRRAYEAQKAEYDAQAAQAAVREETLTKWDKELNYLTSKGDIPAVSPELNTAEAGAKWSTEHADKPGVKERMELFKFMDEENNRRFAAGLDPMNSMIDAHNQMKLQGMLNTEKEVTEKETQTRRSRGSMVSGASPYVPSNQPAGQIIGEGGSLNDLITEYYT